MVGKHVYTPLTTVPQAGYNQGFNPFSQDPDLSRPPRYLRTFLGVLILGSGAFSETRTCGRLILSGRPLLVQGKPNMYAGPDSGPLSCQLGFSGCL